jgi:uncharacterized membrane protein
MIGALVRAVIGGILVAGVVHVVAVLTIPDVAPDDAVDRVARHTPLNRMTTIPADGSVLRDLDPRFVHAACRFDLANGAVAVTGAVPRDVWTLVVVAETVGVAGSLDRGAVTNDMLDLVVGRPGDVERIRLARAETGRPVNSVEVQADHGFVLLRAFAERPRDIEPLMEMLLALRCDQAT